MTEPTEPDFSPYRLSPHVGTGEGCFWIVVAMLYGFAGFAAFKTSNSTPFVVLLLLVGLAPLLLGLKVRRTRLRNAGARFEVTAPARLGGQLQGVLHLPYAVGEGASVYADLVCLRPGETSDSNDQVLGRSYAYGSAGSSPDAGRSQFPISVDIPSDGLASGHSGAYWHLTFIAQAGFGGLDVAFQVTIEA